ncbi:hypothetical protein OG225_39000 [Nocardia sp. NBC_01377]|uniref:DUF7373 family lipoprotein n=1 Tax=Nocardia sp. NBC_01377 TaxID=2903595 RepID=UPI003249C24B
MKSFPARTLWVLLTSAALALGTAACGTEIPGHAVRVQPDTSGLDVGNYEVKPRTVGNAKNQRQARAREAQRLADFVALPYEADPAYVEDAWFVRTHIVLNRKTLGNLVINDTFDDVAKDLVAGWVNAWSTGGAEDAPRRTMNIAVLMFPDANTANSVGPMLENDDFTYNRDNEPVSITKHPNTKAHWRPGVSSIGSWTVVDRYVIFIKVVDDTSAPDLPALITHVERMLDVQIPLLGEFRPTPGADLARIPLDPPGMVGRTLPSSLESPVRPEPDGYYTGRGAVSLFLTGGADTLSLLKKNEVDLVSFGDAVVFRSRTVRGAEALWQEWRSSTRREPDQTIVASPAGLTDRVDCFAQHTGSDPNKYLIDNLCMMHIDRYVVQARGKQLPDLHQKISAQYTLLTSR